MLILLPITPLHPPPPLKFKFYSTVKTRLLSPLFTLYRRCTGFSLVVASRSYSLADNVRASYRVGFSCCRAGALGCAGSVAVACGFGSCGSLALEAQAQ